MARKSRKSSYSQRLSRVQVWALLASIGILTAACALIWYNRTGGSIISTNTGSTVSTTIDSTLQIHIIDVGNADSILVTNNGQALLIDAGENNDGDKVVEYIRSQGVDKLDYVIATHTDSDHIGGMDDVINALAVDTLIMSDIPEDLIPTTKTYQDFMEAVIDHGLSITIANPGSTYAFGMATLTILGPIGTFDSTNNMSVVSRITFGMRHFLFMGDAEKESENALLKSGEDLSADFIKIGHHGSSSSSQKKFLEAVSPRYAAITCGADNDYGHPASSVLSTLKELGVEYYRCDINGTITVTSDGNAVTVNTEK